MATKFLALSCIRKESYGDLSPRPRYPSMPKYPRGVSARETNVEGSEAKAVFCVTGMTSAACVFWEVENETVIGEAKPEQKAEKVEELQTTGLRVAKVGDGMNDSPALVAADVRITSGAGIDICLRQLKLFR